jgi:hypothetical protein
MADEAADGRAPAIQGEAPESDAPADTASPMALDSSAADDLASLTRQTEERFRRTEESFRRLEHMTEGLTRTVGSFMAVISASPVANRLSGEQEAAELAALPTVPILRQRGVGDGPGADSARRDLQRDLESAARGARPRQHDARPDSVNRDASQARHVFPFLPEPPAEADMPREAAETSLLPRPAGVEANVEGADSGPSQSGMLPGGWRLLTRASVQGSVDALPGGVGRALYDPESDGNGRQVREGNDFRPGASGGHPSRAGVAAAMGYGPESIEPSEGGLSRRFPTGMRPPNEGTALSISDKELELFTGIIEIQQDRAGGGCVISGNPIDWLSLAAERLRERRISPAKWVAAVMPRLADSVRQRFRAHFDGEEGALLSTALPFTTPSQAMSTAEAVTWEDFWPWLLAEYLRPAHLDAARRAWAAFPPSSLARLEFDTNAFNTLLLRADMMEAIMQNNVPSIRAPRMTDTYERRETYRRILPPPVLNYVVQFESTRAHAWGAGSSMSSSFLGPSRHQQASDELTLVELQDAALIGARVQLREITRQEQRRGAGSGSSLPADARLTSLEATVQGMAFESFLGADDSPHDSLSLFNVVATHMPDTPPAHVIQERRAAGQCLVCGESTSHWRFTECPRVRANPQLMETMREWLRRERASRPPRRREQAPPAPPRDASRPARPSSSVDREHLNTAIAALQAMASSMASPVASDDSDEEQAAEARS